jgi:murein L,D-transpeptidase YcbB/YkuD
LLPKVLLFLFLTLFLYGETQTVPDFNATTSHLAKKLLQSKKRRSPFLSRNMMKNYYKGYGYHLFWFDENGAKPIAIELINAVLNDPVLQPISRDYFTLDETMLLMSEIEGASDFDISKIVKTDFKITGIYDNYIKLLSRGSIDWDAFEEELLQQNEEKEIIANWDRYPIRKNRRKLLYKALKSNRIDTAIDSVNFTFPNASQLCRALQKYEQIIKDGGFIPLPEFKKLQRGDVDSVVTLLRERLIQEGDLNTTECAPLEDINVTMADANTTENCLEFFDNNVEAAVKNFQRHHGLAVDGVVGPDTRAHLNISADAKVAMIRLNLERMRWLPRNLGKKHLLVNITDYKLCVVDEHNCSLEMPVVVGEPKHPTPVFSHRMTSIVLNPYWRVPSRIVKRELVPKLVKDPTYLDKRGMRMHADWNESSAYYDIKSIDWSVYLKNENEAEDFDVPMRFIQIPSSRNPLGRVKFMFPNKYSVYIHDTSAKRFFRYRKRAYSHGCIRLSKPDALLKYIASDDDNVDYDEAKEILKDINKTKIGLDKSIPIHMVYLTSWVDDSGVIQFRDDIYSYDTMQLKLLNKGTKTK